MGEGVIRGGWSAPGALLAAVLTGLLALALLLADSASAAFPGGNGRIAFATGAAGDDDCSTFEFHPRIWTVNPGPTDEDYRVLTCGSQHINHDHRDPAYSANGAKIAWSRDGDIWKMNADGSNKKQVTGASASDTATDNSPAWSPGGGSIVFAREDGGTVQIVKMHSDGTSKVPVRSETNGGFAEPAWSPNGSWIAYVRTDAGSSCGGEGIINKVRKDGTDDTPLTNAAGFVCAPDWSPDGQTIIFEAHASYCPYGNGEVALMDKEGGNEHFLACASSGPGYLDPVFSPNGNRWAAELDNGSFSNIHTDTVTLTDPRQETFSTDTISDPSWRPD